MKKFYVTTPIYYVNDVPHIGHACTTIAADIMARYHRLIGDKVFFLTGTDEHGAKVAQSAAKEGLSPKEFCDKIAPKFKENWEKLGISYDYFIRTTDAGHEKIATELINKIKDNGHIYENVYKGWYCLGCEAFKTPDELVNEKCPEHPGKELEWYEEKNWFFKLSEFVPKIIQLIESPTNNYCFPEGRRSEILAKLRAGVNDISISRGKVEWGIPVPWDKTQTIYVWIEALMNYYTATQFVDGKEDFWPADLHLVGKGINWFHSVIWQGMLLAAGVDLPKRVFAHSHYNVAGQKMSKSIGNVISPEELIAKFGVDTSRYLIAKSFPSQDDSDITWEKLIETYNADLANNIGNLVSRLSRLAEGMEIDCSGKLQLEKKFCGLLDNQDFSGSIEYLLREIIDPVNVLLNQEKPWGKPSEDPTRQEILRRCIQEVARAGYHLQIIMPSVGQEIIKRLGTGKVTYQKEGLFPRL